MEELITLDQLKDYDKQRAANMVGTHTTEGSINENLIFRATQHTPDYTESAFDGLFYEVTDFIESDQIPEGAKLIYSDGTTLKFCTTLPPVSGLQFGTSEEVAQNKTWFEAIEWMKDDTEAVITVTLADFSYTTPTMDIKNVDGETRSIASQEVQAFVDYRENATDALLDQRSAQTYVDFNKLKSSYLPVGIIIELAEGYDPNTIYPTMSWASLGE